MTAAPASTKNLMNKAMITGNVGRDAELRYTGNGQPVCSFSLASNETWKDKTGEKQQETQWHNCVIWGTRAEGLAPHITKGTHAAVVGKIKYRKYTGKDGVERTTTDIHVDEFEFLGGKGDAADHTAPTRPAETPQYTGKAAAPAKPTKPMPTEAEIAAQFDGTVQPPDDIPF